MLTLLLLGIIVVILLSSGGRKRTNEEDVSRQLARRNQEWADFIAGYGEVAETPAEKSLIQKMLSDIAGQGLGEVSTLDDLAAAEAVPVPTDQADQGKVVASHVSATIPVPAAVPRPSAVRQPIDNTTLLLYFGAFLFVAAAGLFVAFGGASGGVRAFITLLVTVVMYASGIWLYRQRPKLRQAGQAFAGIGIVLAPLVGAALYAYIFNQQHGMAVWFVTSVFCLALYAHALTTFRSPLMGYLLIFTFLSLFESGVGVASAPVYYYGWGLALVGILLQLAHKWKGYWPELQETSRSSAQFMLPLSVLVSLVLWPMQGAMPFGVSLLLAAAFYCLEALRVSDKEREFNAIVSQSSAILGVAAIAYGVSLNWRTTAYAVLAVNMLQLLIVLIRSRDTPLWQNFGSVLAMSSLLGMLLALNSAVMTFVMTAAVVVVGVALWRRQHRADTYGLAALAWMSLSFMYGQWLFAAHLSAIAQTAVSGGALLVLLLVFVWQTRARTTLRDWNEFASTTYILAAASVLAAGVWAGPVVCLLTTVGVAASFVLLAEVTRSRDWAEGAAILFAIPLATSWTEPGVFLASALVAQLVLIGLTLRYRRELLRWASSFVWLLLPVAFGHAAVGGAWTPALYAWSYVLAMAGLIFSRAIARGVLFASAKIPVGSFDRSASMSYVTGYIVAAFLAVIISTASTSSRLHTSLILALLCGTVLLLARVVERRNDILSLLPVLLQGLLLSMTRPAAGDTMLQVFLASSITLALLYYSLVEDYRTRHGDSEAVRLTSQTALATSFVAPFSVLFVESTWLMAIGLLIAGGLVCHYVRTQPESNRELAGAIIVVALWWLLNIAGIHEVQAYVYVLVSMFGLYAYLRQQRGDTAMADQYLYWMLLTATVPLAIQALSGEAGGLYGWWLLLQQVAIMLLGMAIGKGFVTRWGLYVALGAVLYQLRDLGYAALAVLALFLIGLAIYQLQKHTDDR